MVTVHERRTRRIAEDFGLRTSGDHRSDLKGNIGSGGAALRIRTGDGSIRLAKR